MQILKDNIYYINIITMQDVILIKKVLVESNKRKNFVINIFDEKII